LPSLFMVLPKNAKDYEKIKENLMHNENSMITPFNIYNTFNSILNNRRGTFFSMESDEDILKNKISWLENCENFHSQDYFEDQEFICRCKKDL
jgi:hypothetical protein